MLSKAVMALALGQLLMTTANAGLVLDDVNVWPEKTKNLTDQVIKVAKLQGQCLSVETLNDSESVSFVITPY